MSLNINGFSSSNAYPITNNFTTSYSSPFLGFNTTGYWPVGNYNSALSSIAGNTLSSISGYPSFTYTAPTFSYTPVELPDASLLIEQSSNQSNQQGNGLFGSLLGGLAQGVHSLAEYTVGALGLQSIFGPLVDDPIIHPLLWDPLSRITGYDVSKHPSGVDDVSDPLGIRGGDSTDGGLLGGLL